MINQEPNYLMFMFTKFLNLPLGKLAAVTGLSFTITVGSAFLTADKAWADVRPVSDAELTMDKNLSYDLHSTCLLYTSPSPRDRG